MALTNYHIGKISQYSKYLLVAAVSFFVIASIVHPFFKNPVHVSRKAYIEKEGFPFFVSQKEYVQLLKKYPYNPGTKITFHVMMKEESYWDVALHHGITIETLIAANPFLTSLVADEGIEIALPADDGVLFACDNVLDAIRMSRMLEEQADLQGDYMQGFFDILCFDDIRFAFAKNSRPVVVNQHLEGLFEIKKTYHLPCGGQFASLFGMRLDPILHTPDFHEGVDIRAPIGTPVRPIKEGMVVSTGWREGYGLCIDIMHPDGYLSRYGHLSVVKVEKGMMVGKDEIIGNIGSTGRSTGPHLHFEMIRHGQNVNPLFFIW